MLSIASIQTTAFAGSAVGASKVAPQMQFGSFGQKKAAAPAKAAFAYGLPGNFNAVGGEPLNFDPAGFLEGKSELEVNRYREAELTHGRVGMLAAAGFLVVMPDLFRSDKLRHWSRTPGPAGRPAGTPALPTLVRPTHPEFLSNGDSDCSSSHIPSMLWN